MSEHFKLTAAQIASSLLGYCGLGVAVACFLPLILGNAANRRNGTGGLFLVTWLLADFLNIAGIFVLGAPLSQIFLAMWYFIADICLGFELWAWGHPGRIAPDPTPAKALLKKREMEHKHKSIKWFDEQFKHWSFWDNLKLVCACIFVGIAWWGLFIVIMLYKKKGDFEIEVPTSHSTLALSLGIAGTLLFTAARVPELVEGWLRHRKGQAPTADLSDGVFVFLIIENVFNLSSIFVLSLDPSLDDGDLRRHYLQGEFPWILGGVLPIVCDAALVASIFVWQRAARQRPLSSVVVPAERDHVHRLEVDIQRLEAALAHRKELLENVTLGVAAVEHHAEIQAKQEKKKKQQQARHGPRESDGENQTTTRRRRRDRLLAAADAMRRDRSESPHGAVESPLLRDWHKRSTRLSPEYPSNTLKNLAQLDERYGSLNLAPLSAYSASDGSDSPGSQSAGEEMRHRSTSLRSSRQSVGSTGQTRS